MLIVARDDWGDAVICGTTGSSGLSRATRTYRLYHEAGDMGSFVATRSGRLVSGSGRGVSSIIDCIVTSVEKEK